MGTIQKLPFEILGSIFEFAALSEYLWCTALQGVKQALRLSEVNRIFHSVAVNTPSLWSTVSNEQPSSVFKLCMERNKKRLLYIHLFQSAGLEESFMSVIVSQAPRWRELFFDGDQIINNFVIRYTDLRMLGRRLHLPQLRKLTLSYPIPGLCLPTDGTPSPAAAEIEAFEPTDPKYHFYKEWVTPNLQSVSLMDLFPYHTQGSQLKSFEINLSGNMEGLRGDCSPLFSSFPHWRELRNLVLDFHGDSTCSVDTQVAIGVTALPNLETLSATFQAPDLEDFNHPLLSQLDFPNVVKINLRIHHGLPGDGCRDLEFERQFIQSNICCPLRDRTQYPNLSQFVLCYSMDSRRVSRGYDVLKILFDRRDDTPSVRLVFGSQRENDGEQYLKMDMDAIKEEMTRLVEDSNTLTKACVGRLSPIIRSQPGWQDLKNMTVVTEFDDQFAFIQETSRDWRIEREPVAI